MEYQQSRDVDEIFTALANFQSTMSNLFKSKKGYGGRYSYIPMDEMVDAIREPLAANGLSFSQLLIGPNGLRTQINHKSGQWFAGTSEFVVIEGTQMMNPAQAFGSSITYAKRYALASALGLVADEDNDAQTPASNSKKNSKVVYYSNGLPVPPGAINVFNEFQQQYGRIPVNGDELKTFHDSKT